MIILPLHRTNLFVILTSLPIHNIYSFVHTKQLRIEKVAPFRKIDKKAKRYFSVLLKRNKKILHFTPSLFENFKEKYTNTEIEFNCKYKVILEES